MRSVGICRHCDDGKEQQLYKRLCPKCFYTKQRDKNIQAAKNRLPKKLPKRKYKDHAKPKNERSDLIKEADRLFSILVRLRGADSRGFNNCYTCQARLSWKELQCGHFMKRGNLQTRYDFDNARSQCENCNCFQDGRYETFRENLIKEIGIFRVNEVQRKARLTLKLSTVDLREMIESFKKQLPPVDKYFS